MTDVPAVWGRSFLASNGVLVSMNSLGDFTLGASLGQPGVTVPIEDVRMLLEHVDSHPVNPDFTSADSALVDLLAAACEVMAEGKPPMETGWPLPPWWPKGVPNTTSARAAMLRSLAMRIRAVLPPEDRA